MKRRQAKLVTILIMFLLLILICKKDLFKSRNPINKIKQVNTMNPFPTVMNINNAIKDSNSLIIEDEQSQILPSSVIEEISIENVTDIIKKISDEPRGIGTSGLSNAKKTLVNIIEEYGYDTTIQMFNIYKHDNNSTNVKEFSEDYFILNPYRSNLFGIGENIIFKAKYDENKPTLFITAHYDSTNKTYGIIDNASGTSVCIEIARILKDKQFDFNIVFVLFSAEEYYRYGSRYFLSQLTTEEKENILGCINIDMVGQKNAGSIIMKTLYCRPNILSILFEDSFNLSHQEAGGLSDDLSFYFAKIPVVHLINESPNPQLLHEENEIELLDYNQLENLIGNMLNLLEKFNIEDYENLEAAHYSEIYNEFNANYSIDNYELKQLSYNLLENGYTSEIECTFSDGKNQIILLEQDQRLNCINTNIEPKLNIINEHIWYRYSMEPNEILYGSFIYPQIGGIIKTNINENEVVNFLKTRYDNFDYPSIPGLIFDQYIIKSK